MPKILWCIWIKHALHDCTHGRRWFAFVFNVVFHFAAPMAYAVAIFGVYVLSAFPAVLFVAPFSGNFMAILTPCLIRCHRTLRRVWRASALTWAGWIANQIDPDMVQVDANVATLQRLIRASM
jgi:hypothetical protein